MNVSLDPATQHQIERMVDDLCSEFAEDFPRRQIEEVMSDSVERITETARVYDFVPLMAYRFTCERLKAIRRARGEDAEGAWDVVFVSLSGGGRGQIAAALTAKLSRKRVSVHSAGTATRAGIDPQVRTAIAELDLDPDEQFARPVTDEVLRGADVIVTMGHSVGQIEIPRGAPHEDWRIGDPIGAPIQEIRRVRTDIEYRVRALLTRPWRAPHRHRRSRIRRLARAWREFGRRRPVGALNPAGSWSHRGAAAAAPDTDDPGLARERTALAWTRSALTMAASGVSDHARGVRRYLAGSPCQRGRDRDVVRADLAPRQVIYREHREPGIATATNGRVWPVDGGDGADRLGRDCGDDPDLALSPCSAATLSRLRSERSHYSAAPRLLGFGDAVAANP